MKIIPFKKVGQFNFSDDYKTIIKNINGNFKEDILEVIDKKYPRIYIEDLDLMVNFEEDSKRVRFFEFFKDAKEIFFEDIDLISKSYSYLEEEIRKKDPNITIEKSGLESEILGISISKEVNSDIVESVLLGSKSYISEQEIDLDDLYKSIMGEDYPS